MRPAAMGPTVDAGVEHGDLHPEHVQLTRRPRKGEVRLPIRSWRPIAAAVLHGLITDEGVAVGGAFDSDAAPCMMSVAHCAAGELRFRRS
jgi:hypothetical protein